MNKHGGFTLIELMVTIAIVAIFASLAAPSLSSFYTNSKLTSIANDLLVGINYARAESIKRNLPVTICASANGSTCGSDWSAGWIVFVDRNSDGTVDASATPADEIIRQREGVVGNYTIKSNLTNTSGTAVSYINYAINGFANDVGKFAVCYDSTSSTARILSVTLARAKITTSAETSISSCASP